MKDEGEGWEMMEGASKGSVAVRRRRAVATGRLGCWALALAGGLLVALAGCDSRPKETPPDILKGQRQSLERAKGVEQTLQQSGAERREQADQAGK